MMNIKSTQGFISDHVSGEYSLDTCEHESKNDESALSPREVAAKIWDQWMQCRLLTIHLNAYAEFKKNNPD